MLTVCVVAVAVACVFELAKPATSVKDHPAATATAASASVLKFDLQRPGPYFEVGAVGLSTETEELGSGRIGAGDRSLVHLMRLLGPSVLRIGGNSVDRSFWTSAGEPTPSWATVSVTPADLSLLHRLLAVTGWRVLLGVDLGHFEPTRAADEARYAEKILGTGLLGIEIGNEPNDFPGGPRPRTYDVSEYLHEVEAYVQAVKVSAPNVTFVGPDVTQATTWLGEIGVAGRMFSEITQHFYGSSTCPGPPPSIAPTVSGLLSPAERRLENESLQSLIKEGAVTGRPIRLGETNNTACVGSRAVSPVFASALWALDWTLRAAESGVRGINFHGNLGVCTAVGDNPVCARKSGRREVAAQPEYFGLLAARSLEGGRFVPTDLTAPEVSPNLTTWATVDSKGTIRVAIDNLATSGSGEQISIPMPGYTAVKEPLVGPSAAARSGIAFAGAPASIGGSRRVDPSAVRSVHGTLHVVVPSASAVILVMRPARRSG
jgi:hypothetical protein